MSEKNNTKKSNLIKIVLGIVAALAAGQGVDAAGLEIDPGLIDAMKSLGLAGAAALIAYFHFYVMPHVQEAKGDLRRLANKLAPLEQAAPAAELDAEVEEQAVPVPVPVKRVATAPHLRAIKPHKETP